MTGASMSVPHPDVRLVVWPCSAGQLGVALAMRSALSMLYACWTSIVGIGTKDGSSGAAPGIGDATK
ncbi:MAG: hypothetical protein ACI8PT_000175 [Gammaproteobacteria bacterium]|jgi:hypothetical protein